MQKQHDDFNDNNPAPWPDKKHPERIGAIAVIGLVATVICAVGFDAGKHYLPVFLTWVQHTALHLWALFHR